MSRGFGDRQTASVLKLLLIATGLLAFDTAVASSDSRETPPNQKPRVVIKVN